MINEGNIQSKIDEARELLTRGRNKTYKAVIFGTGAYAVESAGLLKEAGIEVSFFCDNNKERWGGEIDGRKILSLEKLGMGGGDYFVFSASFWHSGVISKQLNDMSVPNIPIDAFIFLLNYDKYIKVITSLYDERSRQVYQACMDFLLTASHSVFEAVVEDDVYFSIKQFRYFSPHISETFMDVGAYVGDTLERFIQLRMGNFKKIYALEPGGRQFAALSKRTARLKEEWCLAENQIVCVQAGAGSENKAALFLQNEQEPHGGKIFTGKDERNICEIQILSLDSLIPANEGVDFIKADVEGSEIDMLMGAERLIKRCRPKLAISLYHKALDYCGIPLLIKSFVPEYKMAVRHGTLDRGDTVLLCWI